MTRSLCFGKTVCSRKMVSGLAEPFLTATSTAYGASPAGVFSHRDEGAIGSQHAQALGLGI